MFRLPNIGNHQQLGKKYHFYRVLCIDSTLSLIYLCNEERLIDTLKINCKMKSLLFTGLMAVLLFKTALSQSNAYQPMLNSDAFWRIGEFSCGIFMSDIQVTSQDTSIDGQLYKIVTQNYEWDGPSHQLYIREDVNTRRVYRYSLNLQAELLIYDFSLNQGDSFDLAVESWDNTVITYPHIIDSIGQVQLQNGLWYRHFFLTRQATPEDPSTYAYSWIEGLGCDSLPVFNYVPYPWYSTLLCHKLKGEILWNVALWGNYYCDDAILSDTPSDNNSLTSNTGLAIRIMPNPSNDFWLIDIGTNPTNQDILRLYSLDGQHIKDFPTQGQQTLIENHQLAVGIYILQLVTDNPNETVSFRLVKGN